MLHLLAAFCGAALTGAAGYGLGRRLTRGIHLPESVRFAVGAAALSVFLFAILLLHMGRPWVFACIGLGGIALLAMDRPSLRLARPPLWIAAVAFIYAALYLVYALTPEIQPDALSYHLSLAVEAKRSGGFPSRATFYDVLPQGMETLFAMANGIGGEAAPKLVHLVFLFLTIPLLVSVAKLLDVPEWTAWSAGLLYALTPVAGVSGTSAYSDAAMTFYVLAVFHLLVLWWSKQNTRLLLPLGLCAGFCYAIKFTGGLMALVVLGAIVCKRARPWNALAGMIVVAAPWMIRAAILTGNPFSPLLNRFFPNPFFHIDAEQALGRFLRDYGGVEWQSMALEVTLYGDLVQGLLGPLWLLAPIALLALRTRQGRVLLAAALIAGAPWFLNIGTRFLMPALPFLGLAMCMAMPRALLPVLLTAHAIASWPDVIPLWAQPGAWALNRENSFGKRTSHERVLADLVESNTRPGDRIFDFANAPAAIVSRDLINAWQSALGDRLVRGLFVAIPSRRDSMVEWRSEFPPRSLTAVRVRYAAAQAGSAGIREIALFDKDQHRLNPNVLWSLSAWPNVWDAPLVLDRNLVSGWAIWEPVRAGMYVEIELPSAQVAQVRIMADSRLALELYGKSGEWVRLPLPDRPEVWPELNLRRAAIRLLRREGITHVLAVEGSDSFGAISKDMIESPAEWGLRKIAEYGSAVLFKLN